MSTREAFFALLRAGLWEADADAAPFGALTAADWQGIFARARQQALIGICFDGVCRLPQALRPPRPLYLQWAALALQVEQANRSLDDAIAHLFPLYRRAGLHPVLLKGQGNARHYANPLRRRCGDIDIYLGREGQPVANRLLIEAGAVPEGEASPKHTSYSYRGVHIENHRTIAHANSPLADRRLQRIIGGWYPAQTVADEAAGIAAPVPPLQFDVLYIFLHAFGHFLNSGIGLRQVCDWARLVERHHAEIDAPLLQERLRQLGLLRAAVAFGYVAVHYVGLPARCLPFSIEGQMTAQLGEALVADILQTGNFGQYDRRVGERPKGYWAGKWHTFCRACRRCVALYRFAPAEAVWYPLRLIQHSLGIQWRKVISK